jgi:hypothetical protein
MIVIKVELWSAVNGERKELARMIVDNIGGTEKRGYYRARTLIGRSSDALDLAMFKKPMKTSREGFVGNYPRLQLHVWNLVARALTSMGYK